MSGKIAGGIRSVTPSFEGPTSQFKQSNQEKPVKVTQNPLQGYGNPVGGFKEMCLRIKAVCQVVYPDHKLRNAGHGTGFLIGNGLLITNHHVIPDKETAEKNGCFARFFYEESGKESIEVRFNPCEKSQGYFYTSPSPDEKGFAPLEKGKLDFTIVALQYHPALEKTYRLFFSILDPPLPQKEENANIIHHPAQLEGKKPYKQIALRQNRITVIESKKFIIHYETPTAPGSSGAPVMNDEGIVFGLHRSKCEEHQKCNTAILMRSIVQEIRSKGVLEKIKQWTGPIHAALNQALCMFYTSKEKNHISLLIPLDPKEIPIEKLYTRLAVIGEKERKKKNEETEKNKPGQSIPELGDERIPTHESIFEPKEAIKLEDLFNHDQLKNTAKKRVLIQGAAGIGKSTLCHYIAHQWAKKNLFNNFEYLFWLPLRNLNKDSYPSGQNSLERYLSKECGVDQKLIEFFLSHKELWDKTLILLDGYDELSADATNQRGSLYQILKQLKDLPHVIITSRPQSVDFKVACNLEILGFDAKGIEEYTDRFFSESPQGQAQQLRTYLKQPLARSLAHIPINLEIFCSLAVKGELSLNSKKPITMTVIYSQLTEWLFKRFRIERSPQLNTPETVLEESDARHADDVNPLAEALEELAWEAMDKDTLYLSEAQITNLLRSIAKMLNTRIDIESIRTIGPLRIKDKQGVFIHLTFQENFAAARLARLYKDNRIEAQRLLQEIKFEPRYQLVLHMTAGILSCHDELYSQSILQLFFDDLFSEPYDLAETYELNLMARCFEECKKPEKIKQHEKWIDKVVDYVQLASYQPLIIQILHGNQKLIKHVIEHFLLYRRVRNGLDIIHALASYQQFIPLKIVKTIIELKDIDAFRSQAISALGEIGKAGSEGGQLAVTALGAVAQNPSLDRYVQDKAISALVEIGKIGGEVGQLAVTALNAMAQNPSLDRYVQDKAISVLGKIERMTVGRQTAISLFARKTDVPILEKTEKMGEIGQQAVAALTAKIQDQSLKGSGRKDAASALGKIAKARGPIDQQAIDGLTSMIKEKSLNRLYRSEAVSALEEIGKMEGLIGQQAVTALILLVGDQSLDGHGRGDAASALEEIRKAGGEMGQQAVAALSTMIQDPNLGGLYKRSAASALGEIGKKGDPIDQGTVNGLNSMMQEKSFDQWDRQEAASALGKIAEAKGPIDQRVVTALISMVQDQSLDKSIRKDIPSVLGKIAKAGGLIGQNALCSLISIVQDPSLVKLVRDSAVSILIEVGKTGIIIDKWAVDILVSIMRNESFNIWDRREAASALGEIGKTGGPIDKNAIDALSAMVQDPLFNGWGQSDAASALRKIGKSGGILGQQSIVSLFKFVQASSAQKVQIDVCVPQLKQLPFKNYLENNNTVEVFILSNACYLTGRAFSYSNGVIHLIDKEEKIAVEKLDLNDPQLKKLVSSAKAWRS